MSKKTTIDKATLARDFEAGKLCIEYDRASVRASAIYLADGQRFTVRFDTYLSLHYANSNSPFPKGFGYLRDYVFYNLKTAKAFQASILPSMRIEGEAYLWGVSLKNGFLPLLKKFQTRAQAEASAWEHPYYHKKPWKLEVFNEKTGERYAIEN